MLNPIDTLFSMIAQGNECGDPFFGEENAHINVTLPHTHAELVLEFRVNATAVPGVHPQLRFFKN